MKKIQDTILTLLFPPRCPVCDNVVRIKDGRVCRECRDKWQTVGKVFCMKCGRPLAEAGREYCEDCQKRDHVFIQGRAVYRYKDIAASVYRFKYGGRQEYAAFFGAKMAEEFKEFVEYVKPDGLVPVPVSSKRLKRRGYNQAELLAKVCGEKLGVPVYTHMAVRVKDTLPQKTLNAYQRQNNLKRAFKIKENDVKLSTIIIIDDIYTTGSTIDALATAFMEQGVEKIYYAVLAIGV